MTSRAEYQREILDAFTDPAVTDVVMMSSAQVGKTEILGNAIGYFIDHDPSPILVVDPTLDVAKSWSKDRLAPMLRDTPALKDKVKDVRSRDADNTVLHKRFPGGHITIAGANSASSLASRPIRIVLCDEVDRFPESAGTEGDPVELAFKRTTTFFNRKRGLFSTPTVEGVSRIEAAYEQSDKRKYWVPCPHCGESQVLRWPNVRWPEAKPREAVYHCEFCGEAITDRHKHGMLLRGRWVAEREFTGTAGFWINELYSPWVTFADMAERWLRAQGDNQQLQVFINTSLGETWKQVVSAASDEDVLLARADFPAQIVPPEAVALTAGVDCQKHGFYFAVRAWARDYTSWMIHYGFLPTWADVESLLFESAYQVAGADGLPVPGQDMRIWRAALDTGGGDKDTGQSMTEEAYWWLTANVGRGCMVWGTKGASHQIPGRFRAGEPLVKTPSGRQLPIPFRIILVDTAAMKDTYHYHLGQARQGLPKGAYLHRDTGSDYVRQITAEEKRLNKHGLAEWTRIRRDNHFLDAEVLAFSVAHPEWVGGGVNLRAGESKPRPKPAGSPQDNGWVRRKSNWFKR